MGNSGGRPYYFATLPPEKPRILVIGRFYDIIDVLSSAEMKGLARALYRSPHTVAKKWKYRQCCPPYDVMLRVIEWDDAGRPLTKRKVTQSYVDLF